MEKITFDGPDDPRIAKYSMGHGIPSHKEHWVVKDLAPGNSIPTSQAFGGANGGEYRKSFHGYAPGYAQVIESPRQFHITPMQIDTWNRDKMNLTYPSKMVSGPVPRSTLAPIDGPTRFTAVYWNAPHHACAQGHSGWVQCASVGQL